VERSGAVDQAAGTASEAKGPGELVYPVGRTPEPGELIDLGHGVRWARLPLFESLDHINSWILDDRDERGEGVAVVDCGMNSRATVDAWEALLAGPLAGVRVTRVIATHFHPDHLGMAGWLCRRFDAGFWMSRVEWLTARAAAAPAEAPPEEAVRYWRYAGWDEERLDAARRAGWAGFSKMVTPIPASYRRLSEGDVVEIGDGRWQVLIGRGHSPEHACLWNEAAGMLLSGDQVLPRISSNVSLSFSEPDADPLAEWFASIDRFQTLPAETMILPAHGQVFRGLQPRLTALKAGHQVQLRALAAFIAEQPRRAIDCFPVLFRREPKGGDLQLATGEALAHLRRLEREGQATCVVRDGVAWFAGP